ncbi:hypothetical protein [Stenotrophomonas sp. PSU-St15]
MNTTMADGAEQRLDAQIAEALFDQPGMSKMDVANRVRELRGDGPALLGPREAGQDERARFEAWCEQHNYSRSPAQNNCGITVPERYGHPKVQLAWEAWQAALSAQPSPGGQDATVRDDMVQAFKAALARAQLPGKNRTYFLKDSELPSILSEVLAARQPEGATVKNSLTVAALQPVDGDDLSCAHLAGRYDARQPVGESMWVEIRREGDRTFPRVMKRDHAEAFLRTCNVGPLPTIHALYAAPPAQADQEYLESLDRALEGVIDQRDRYHEVADDLAGHIAAITGVDIGEHSSANCPWQNAIEAAEEYQPAQAVNLEQTFQAGVSDWMDKCFLPSLYSNMTERGDRLLEEVLELLQAHGYDPARVPTLVDYVFSRPAGDPAQEVGGVMVTLAGYCWVAGLDMHVHGHAELARISHPEVMAKIRAKQEAKNALHFDTPLPGDAGASTTEEWPREGDLVRYGEGSSALAIRLGPHAGGWHGYQCCGGYTFFTKAYRPSRADMDTWLDCAKYRDERTRDADIRVAQQLEQFDSQAVQS